MKNITLHAFREKRPKNDSVIIYFSNDRMGFCEMRCEKVEYFWDDGEGNSVQYHEDDNEADFDGYKLTYSVGEFNGFEDDESNWMYAEDGYNEEVEKY